MASTQQAQIKQVIAEALWKAGNLRLGIDRPWSDVADAYHLDAQHVVMALDEAGFAVGEKAWNPTDRPR